MQTTNPIFFSKKTLDTLSTHDVNFENGFLPANDPLQYLGEPYEAWEALATDLSSYINAGSFRAKIAALPLIDTKHLQTNAALERAMILLSYFAHSYVNGPAPQQKQLPKNISIPWSQVAQRLGRHPIISHAVAVLNNWKRLDPNKPIQLDNLAQMVQFHGGVDESWFFLATTNIEKVGAPAIPLLIEALHYSKAANAEKCTSLLTPIIPILQQLNQALLRIYEWCDPHIFYLRVRPFLASFENIIYEGVSDIPVNYHGASAAQSSLLQLFDSVLGMNYEHNPSTKNYLLEMRKYMPPKHAALLHYAETESNIRTLAQANQSLQQVYTEAIDQLIEFRNEHLKLVSIYIMKQAKKTNQSAVGTGGTNPLIFLKSIRNRNEDLKK